MLNFATLPADIQKQIQQHISDQAKAQKLAAIQHDELLKRLDGADVDPKELCMILASVLRKLGPIVNKP